MKFKILESSICDLAISLPCLRPLMVRHQRGDWGCVNPSRAHKNQLSLREGGLVTSVFPAAGMQVVMVSTVFAGFASTKVVLNRSNTWEIQNDFKC